ncbi:MAG: VWA domain-containing protein [Thermoanaerobaculia bacterium]
MPFLPCLAALAALGATVAGTPGGGALEPPAEPPADSAPSPSPVIRLVPPLEDEGRARVHALVTDTAVDTVRFFVGGEEVRTDRRRPFHVSVDLNPEHPPDPGAGDSTGTDARTLRAVAHGRDGRVLGEDRLPLETRRQGARLAIREIEPARSGGAVRVALDLTLPGDEALSHVELYRNRELHARLEEPPFEALVPTPEPSPEDYVRAVAVLAGGETLEDARPLAPAGTEERLEVALVELVAVVTDRRGEPVRGLGPESFRVLLDGRELPLQRFREAREVPLSVGLLVDSSNSMAPVMEPTREAAARFLERTLQPGDRGFLVDVDSVPRIAHGLTGDPELLEAAFAALEVGGDTALVDAMVLAAVELREVPGRRALVALTDGRDFGSHWRLGACGRFARRFGTPIYVVSVGGLARYTTRPDENLRLAAFARDTGGRLFPVTRRTELDRVYDRIEGELRSQYLLSVATDRVLSHEELERLDVQVDGRGLDARVATRRPRAP